METGDWFTIRDADETRPTRATATVTDEGEQRKRNVLYMENVRLDTRKNFFNVRVIRDWNALPEHVKAARTVNSFKNQLDKWNKSK